MKKSFMTRALAMGLSLAMAFSLSAATNVSVASAASKPAMASKQFAVRVGGAAKSYKASAATQKSYKITKATVGNTDKATVKVNSSKKSIKVTPGTVTGTTVVTVTFKNIKTAKSTAKKYRCVVKAALEEKPVEPEVVKATKITEAKASSAKVITVKFDGAVDTTSATAIKLVRGTTDITVTPAFSADKTELVLTASTALAAGNYTVTVGSFAPVSFNVAKQVPTTLKINNTTVANKDNARVYFQVLDQYGDVMPNYTAKKLSITAYNTTKGHTVSPYVANSSDDYFCVKTGTQTTTAGLINAIDDTISIVAYLTETPSVSCTASLKIVRVYTESLEFGDVVLGSHKRVTTGNTYELQYTAKNNEGADVVFESDDITGPSPRSASTVTIGDYTFVSSNPSAVSMVNIKIDSKKKMTFQAGTRGTAVITAINNITGANSTLTIEVNDEPTLAALDIADASVAKGTSSGTFTAAVVAYDQFGEVIDAQNLKNQSLTGYFATITNSMGVNITPTKFSADGKYIVYTVGGRLATEGTTKFTFVSTVVGPNGTITSNSDVEIGDVAEPSALEIIKEPAATAITGDDIKIQLAVKDQYQNKMPVASLGGINGSSNYEIELDNSDVFNISAATPSAVNGQNKVYEIPVKTTYTGSAADAVSKTGTLTVSLKEGAKVIDSKTFTVKVGKALSGYEVTTDSDVYKAGDKITVTVKALSQSGAQLNTLLNGDVKFSVVKTESATPKTTYETLTFKDGVATLTLKAEKVCNDGSIVLTDIGRGITGTYSDAGDNQYEVLTGAVGKLDVDTVDGQLVFKDSAGNAVVLGSGYDYSSYATVKLMNKTTGKEIAVKAISGAGLTTTGFDLKANQTMSVTIHKNDGKITSMGAIDNYGLDGTNGTQEMYVYGVTAADAVTDDLLEFTITINGVTWTSSVRYSGLTNNYVAFKK